MKKVYLIYIKLPPYVYLDRICHLAANTDFRFRHKGKYIYGLYAYTDNMKLLKEFISTRYAPLFKVKTIKKKNMDDAIPKDIAISLKLNRYQFYHNDKYDPQYTEYQLDDSIEDIMKDEAVTIVATREEYNNCTTFISENILEHLHAKYINPEVDYTLFNDEIEDALDVLGYITNYDLLYTSESGLSDMIDFNKSFNMTYRGHPLDNNVLCNMHHNQYFAFIYLYSYLILGEMI